MPTEIPEDEPLSANGFAGDALLRLATNGSLVLAPVVADELIGRFSEALDLVRVWCALNMVLRHRSRVALIEIEQYEEQPLFDAAFAEQIAPGRLREALAELPKYIQALTIAKRNSRNSGLRPW